MVLPSPSVPQRDCRAEPLAEPAQRPPVHQGEEYRDHGNDDHQDLDGAGVEVDRQVAEDVGGVAPREEAAGPDGGTSQRERRQAKGATGDRPGPTG